MANHPRVRIQNLPTINELSKGEIKKLRNAGNKRGSALWSKPGKILSPALVNFKAQVKTAYRLEQRIRCCYCSSVIKSPKHSGFELDHILDKKDFPEFMFELKNLAVACGSCNSHKAQKKVFSATGLAAYNADKSQVPFDSLHYDIVHPHLDEWTTHFDFDKFSRIFVNNPDAGNKGGSTYEICDLGQINAMRLLDYFDTLYGSSLGVAENALQKFYSYAPNQKKRKKKLIDVLRNLAAINNLASAAELVNVLDAEIDNK